MSWDKSLGILLLVCGLALALWDRQKTTPPAGNATVRKTVATQ
jgi:hypothetical protein